MSPDPSITRPPAGDPQRPRADDALTRPRADQPAAPGRPSSHLLDVNAVIALIDPLHVHHDRAHQWFASRRGRPWHTCPIVQNGVVRVVSHPKYPNSQPAPVVLASLASLAAHEDHVFLPDSVSLLDSSIHTERLLASAQVTDSYLLHLAASHDALLATFDTRIVTAAVPSGAEVLYVIP